MSDIIKFLSEISGYRRATRLGPKLAGIPFEEYLASHVVRAAQIAYILAGLEGANAEKTACIVLFHDNGELRVGDQHKVAARYVDISAGERQAFSDQIALLPEKMAEQIQTYYNHFEKRDTKEGTIARDADWLEVALFAKEMTEIGYKSMQVWIDNVAKALETKSAQNLLAKINNTVDFSTCWWQGLKKMTYTKMK